MAGPAPNLGRALLPTYDQLGCKEILLRTVNLYTRCIGHFSIHLTDDFLDKPEHAFYNQPGSRPSNQAWPSRGTLFAILAGSPGLLKYGTKFILGKLT